MSEESHHSYLGLQHLIILLREGLDLQRVVLALFNLVINVSPSQLTLACLAFFCFLFPLNFLLVPVFSCMIFPAARLPEQVLATRSIKTKRDAQCPWGKKCCSCIVCCLNTCGDSFVWSNPHLKNRRISEC